MPTTLEKPAGTSPEHTALLDKVAAQFPGVEAAPGGEATRQSWTLTNDGHTFIFSYDGSDKDNPWRYVHFKPSVDAISETMHAEQTETLEEIAASILREQHLADLNLTNI